MPDRKPSESYMKFVKSMATKILDPKTVITPNGPKCAQLKQPR